MEAISGQVMNINIGSFFILSVSRLIRYSNSTQLALTIMIIKHKHGLIKHFMLINIDK